MMSSNVCMISHGSCINRQWWMRRSHVTLCVKIKIVCHFECGTDDIKMSNRNKKVNCSVCHNMLRADTLKRHMKTHKDLLSLREGELEEELRSRHESRLAEVEQEQKRQKVVDTAKDLGLSVPEEMKDPTSNDESDVRKRLVKNNEVYLRRVKVGEMISKILYEGDVREQSLTKEDKEALVLYREQVSNMDVNVVVLRPWQKDMFEIFQEPANDRTVTWIYDEEGNNGKSWFQNYVQAYFGYHRVFRCDLRIKHKDMCNILRKRSTATVDIFLFNDSRSINGEEPNMYRILEDIKDGAATTSKYDNQRINFKTPNFVMVFSNSWPNRKHLSKDRWQIYEPTANGLEQVKKDRAKMKDVSVRFANNKR